MKVEARQAIRNGTTLKGTSPETQATSDDLTRTSGIASLQTSDLTP